MTLVKGQNVSEYLRKEDFLDYVDRLKFLWMLELIEKIKALKEFVKIYLEVE
jgi:hypothetical protein